MNPGLRGDDEAEEGLPPYDPVKILVFAVLVSMVAFAGWRLMRAKKAVAAVAEASKDYRKLFPSRGAEALPEPPKPVVAAPAAPSSMMLSVDEDMKVKPAPRPVAEKPAAAPPEAPPVAAKAVVAAPAKRGSKAFNQPRLNSGAFSGLNGGSGIGFSGGQGGGGGAPPAAAGTPDAAAAAAAAAAVPGMPAIPGVTDKK